LINNKVDNVDNYDDDDNVHLSRPFRGSFFQFC